MDKKLLVTLLSLLLLLASCSTQTFDYSGESENWSANLKVEQTSNDYETQDFVLEYKGSDISSVGEITYYVDTVGGFGGSGATLEDNGTLQASDEANPTNAKVSEHTEVEVRVEWNDNTETFKLTKK
ncbi:hypothetical protein [Halobacillus yeomjeoni]|uniref:Lipoprotein n=1 Tax=Halobacillus yeomjeoni TaxID=311194 RepID=A0A931HT95_9BACI|nr:hypothetical protein [Halobacillus yeomjeoni]MBH0229149.1 hypothetical protein [Halobacillus yeomjeoni]